MKTGKILLIVLVIVVALVLIWYFTLKPAKKYNVNRFVNQDNAPDITWVGINETQTKSVPLGTFKKGNKIKITGSKHDGTYEVLDVFTRRNTADGSLAIKRIQLVNPIAGEGEETEVERVTGVTIQKV